MRWIMSVLLAVLVAGSCSAAEAVDKPIQIIPLPNLDGAMDHLALDKPNSRLFITSLGKSAVAVADLKIGRLIIQISGLPKPQGVAVAADIDRVAITCDTDGGCHLCDRKTLRQLAMIALGEDADNVRYEPIAKRFWVGCGTGSLAVIDPLAPVKVAEVKLGSHPESFQFESKGKRVFVNVPLSGYVGVIDREKFEIIAKWRPEGAAAFYPMALDEEHHRLFIGCRKPAKMLVLDTETGKEIASLDCVSECDDLYYDATASQIYITGSGGAITVIKQADADHYKLARIVSTGDGARTSLLDPENGWLYVAIPHHGEKQRAEIRVYDMRGLGQ